MPRRNGLILRQNGFTVIINGDFLEEGGVVRPITLTYGWLICLYPICDNCAGSRLFGSLVEHWTFNPASRVQISTKAWDFFSEFSMLCSLLRLSCRKMGARPKWFNSTPKWLYSHHKW